MGGSELPLSVALGFKRKELSYVSLVESETDGNSPGRTVSLASLIATANFVSQVTGEQKEI